MMRFSRSISTIDAHAGGEPLRIVTAGLPPLPESTMLERRAALRDRHDDLRRLLMWEPRGHADMYGCVLTPPVTPAAQYGVLFMHNEGYSTMCGHGIIALTTALLETGTLECTSPVTEVGYDTPAGFVLARAEIDAEDRVRQVTFRNVPSFVYAANLPITIADRRLTVDVVFGGAFYALVEATALDPTLTVRPERIGDLIARGMAVKQAVEAAIEVVHPAEPGLRGIYGTIVTGPAEGDADGRNVTIFAEGEVDRSPCGTGTAARLAALYARGVVALGEEWVHQSVIGSRFTARVVAETDVAGHPAIVPEIGGQGFLTGFSQFVVDPADTIGRGFLLR